MVADLHIHTALSPCAEDDMTPNNIVNMAALCGIDCIAVTDHSSCKNCGALIAAARLADSPLCVIPGMELTTSEEIHVICLFPDIESAMSFDRTVEAALPDIQNRPQIFGRQLLMNEYDEIIGEFPKLLLSASQIDVYSAVKVVGALGGIAYPAHIDRDSFSILSNLGMIPEDLDISVAELSAGADRLNFSLPYRIITASDAHRLSSISEESVQVLDVRNPTPKKVIDFLKAKQAGF